MLTISSVSLSWSLEETLVLGREQKVSWLDIVRTEGLSKVSGKWDSEELVLQDAEYRPDSSTDLLVHFNVHPYQDETDHFEVIQESAITSSKIRVLGRGAAVFQAFRNPLSLIPTEDSVFHSGWQDFSLEFWLYAANMSDREEVLSWNSFQHQTYPVDPRQETLPQTLRCRIYNRRLHWEFVNFFVSENQTDFRLTGATALLPRRWYHHILRFDSTTGMLEYLVNGVPEGVIYITDTGEDGGSVYMPSTTRHGRFLVGQSLTGIIDELRITRSFVDSPNLSRYGDRSGIGISRVFDLEYTGSTLKSIEADYDTPSDTEVYFYYRIANTLKDYQSIEAPWRQFDPQSPLPEAASGRFLQLRVELLADGKLEQTPRISQIVVRYEPDLPPLPPSQVIATAGNAEVTIDWQEVVEKDVKGYLIYYGRSPGIYTATDSAEGDSPIDVGDQTSFTLTGLENGKLYYFAVVSYDSATPAHQSRFSEEVGARPSNLLP
jgi:hypothetical protein